MINLLWGGIESNQIGTVEFVDYCRQIGADALVCVNFESDGRRPWMKDPNGNVRTAGPDEAAEWVDYCNNPESLPRLADGLREPCRIPLPTTSPLRPTRMAAFEHRFFSDSNK